MNIHNNMHTTRLSEGAQSADQGRTEYSGLCASIYYHRKPVPAGRPNTRNSLQHP